MQYLQYTYLPDILYPYILHIKFTLKLLKIRNDS